MILFKHHLAKEPWTDMIGAGDIDSKYNVFSTHLKYYFDFHSLWNVRKLRQKM